MSVEISYHIVGILPVKQISDLARKVFLIQKVDGVTGCFVNGGEMLGAISHGTSDVEEVDKEEFIYQVELFRSRRVKAEGELSVLYDEIRIIVDTLRSEKRRRFTPEEKQRLAELTRQSYELFEKTIGCEVCSHIKEYD